MASEEFKKALNIVDHITKIKIYNGFPYCPAVVLRVEASINGEDYGMEGEVMPDDKVSLGMRLDTIIEKLSKTIDEKEEVKTDER